MSRTARLVRDLGPGGPRTRRRHHGTRDRPAAGIVQEMTLFAPAPSIYGGTDEIQKNIIGERVLGLPKEPGPDKSLRSAT